MPNPCQIHAKSMPNPCQIHAKSMPNPCQIHANPEPNSCQSMPIQCQSGVNLSFQFSANRSQSWANRVPIGQSGANPVPIGQSSANPVPICQFKGNPALKYHIMACLSVQVSMEEPLNDALQLKVDWHSIDQDWYS